MGEAIRVALAGYGRLGSELARGLVRAPDVELVGIVRRSRFAEGLAIEGSAVQVTDDLPALLDRARPRVLVEASLADAAHRNVMAALERGISPVIATSGLGDAQVEEIRAACRERGIGGVWAPNLSLGAVVLMHLAAVAGRFFDHAEIIELHRDSKADAPSGTALHTARLLAQARGRGFARSETTRFTLPDVRGGQVDGVGIHSVRLPGLIAHQEVLFGGLGQTLTLRHDTTSNESYVPGTLLAIKHAVATRELTDGLAALLGLSSV